MKGNSLEKEQFTMRDTHSVDYIRDCLCPVAIEDKTITFDTTPFAVAISNKGGGEL